MKGRLAAVALPACLLLLSGSASASFDVLLTVAQPMREESAGHYRISYVTYLMMITYAEPGLEINFTAAPGGVMERANKIVDSLYVRNLNEAELWGLHVWTESIELEDLNVEIDSTSIAKEEEARPTRGFVDTLDVTLDVSDGLKEMERRSDCSNYFSERIRPGPNASADEVARYDERVRQCEEGRREMNTELLKELLDATLACILDNASRSTIAINRIRLIVRGAEQFSGLGGIYKVPPPVFTERTFPAY